MYNLEKSMMETIKSDLGGISSEIVEIGIDSLMKEGIFRNIPVINVISSLYSLGINVKDRFFIKKLLIFLNSLNETTQEERIKFLSRHCQDESSLGEKLIVILDRLDDIQKAQFVANLFISYLYENIDLFTFQRLSQIIDRCFVEDLNYLKMNPDKEVVSGIIGLGLSTSGLATLASLDGGSFDEVNYDPENDYKLNKTAKILIKYGFRY